MDYDGRKESISKHILNRCECAGHISYKELKGDSYRHLARKYHRLLCDMQSISDSGLLLKNATAEKLKF